MKSQVLLTVWCHISCEAAGEFWHWSLSGVKGLICLGIPVSICILLMVHSVNAQVIEWGMWFFFGIFFLRETSRGLSLWLINFVTLGNPWHGWVLLHVVLCMSITCVHRVHTSLSDQFISWGREQTRITAVWLQTVMPSRVLPPTLNIFSICWLDERQVSFHEILYNSWYVSYVVTFHPIGYHFQGPLSFYTFSCLQQGYPRRSPSPLSLLNHIFSLISCAFIERCVKCSCLECSNAWSSLE